MASVGVVRRCVGDNGWLMVRAAVSQVRPFRSSTPTAIAAAVVVGGVVVVRVGEREWVSGVRAEDSWVARH